MYLSDTKYIVTLCKLKLVTRVSKFSIDDINFGMALMELPERRRDFNDFSWHTQVGKVSNSLSSSHKVVKVRKDPNYDK